MEIIGDFFPRGGGNFPRNYEGRRYLCNHFKRGVEILGANSEGRRNILLISEISLPSLIVGRGLINGSGWKKWVLWKIISGTGLGRGVVGVRKRVSV